MEGVTSSLQKLTMGHASKCPAATHGPHSPVAHARLEILPVELQSLILSQAPTFQTLSALVHASPALHSTYRGSRLRILKSALGQNLRGMLAEATAVHYSSTDAYQENDDEIILWRFTDPKADYTVVESAWIAQMDIEEIIQLVHFHFAIIEPLTERYACRAMALLPTSSDEGQIRQKCLSDTETRRIQRAMYRLQLECNILAPTGEKRRRLMAGIEESIDNRRTFSYFSKWDAEQVFCVLEFALDVYRDIFRQVACELKVDKNPKYQHLDFTATVDDLLLMEGWGDVYSDFRELSGVHRHGLGFLLYNLKAERHEQLVTRLAPAIFPGLGQDRMNYGADELVDQAIDDLEKEQRRARQCSQRHACYVGRDFRHKEQFEGDSLDSAPLGWILLSSGKFDKRTRVHIPAGFRRWGYVMWDSLRLGSKAETCIEHWLGTVQGIGEDSDSSSDGFSSLW